jgi:hypothetical protein
MGSSVCVLGALAIACEWHCELSIGISIHAFHAQFELLPPLWVAVVCWLLQHIHVTIVTHLAE